MVSAKVVATYSMGVVLVFTVRIRTILQLHPFGMFQGLFVRYREPALDIHHDDAIISEGAQWLSGRVLDSRPKGRGFEPHRRHCVVVLEQDTFILA